MNRHSTYHNHTHHHQLSQVLHSVLEQHLSINPSKMASIYQTSGHLEMKLKQCAINEDHHRNFQSPIIIDQNMVSFDCRPIDLSKRANNVPDIYTDDVEMDLIDEGFDLNIKSRPEIKAEEEISDKPLNLSICNSAKASDLLQKQVRLEEMVRYIRKCSVGEEPEFRSTNAASHHSCDASDAESDGDNICVPMKRSLSCSAMSSTSNGGLSRHRRKHTVPNRGSKVLNIDYDVRQSLYPVLRQQLLRSYEGSDADEIDEDLRKCSSTVANENLSQWPMYTYYANIFQSLQSSVPESARGLSAADKRDDIHAQQKGTDNVNLASSTSGHLRKRAPRALTGKHVKQGTGASPSTLLTLRQKIEHKLNQQNQLENGSSGAKNSRARSVTKKANKRKGSCS